MAQKVDTSWPKGGYIWPAFHTRPTVASRKGVVAAGHFMATSAGMRMFAKGGNAIDAGIATAFALDVLRPHKNGIGGESPTLIYSPKHQKTFAISGVGNAPKALSIEWLRERGIKSIPGFGYLGALVPAQIGCFLTALKLFGTLPLDVVLEPAIELCFDGYPIYEGLREFLDFTSKGLFTKLLPENGNIFLNNGQAPVTGDTVRQPDMGRTFQRLSEAYQCASKAGRDAGIDAAIDLFYKGDIAREILDYVNHFELEDSTGKHVSLLTYEDFATYETRVEEPLSVNYRNFTVFKCGPWSQGPVMLQNLKLLEGFDLKKMGHNSAQYIHTVIECSKIAYNDRNRFYGDQRFVDVPFDKLLSDEYAAQRRKEIDPYFANNAQMWDDDLFDSSGEIDKDDTTHFDAADAEGYLISSTPSGGWIRSSPRVPGVGLQLTTRGQMFYMNPKAPNCLEPGKRPRTTLTPTLAYKDGKPWMAFGSPGGDNQDQWGVQTFLNVAEFGMYLQNAIDAPSFYTNHFRGSFYPHDAQVGLVTYEPLPAPIVNDLIARGHKMRPVADFNNGECSCVCREDDGFIYGAASPKEERQSYAMGW